MKPAAPRKLLSEYIYMEKDPELIILYRYENDRLAAKEYLDPDEKLQRTELFTYTETGELASYRCITHDNIVINYNIYEYSLLHKDNWLKRIKYSVSEDSRKIREIPIEVLYRSINYFEQDLTISPETGKSDYIKFPNGVYKGDTVNGLMHGKGVFNYNDGSRYEGGFSNGVMDGKGTLKSADGKIYKGEFREGVMEGKGLCRWPNGDEYKGDFHKGMMHGIGVFRWKNGSRFKGLFEKNERTDQGLIETGDNQ